ncbi:MULTISPECIES: MarR family winged helix-turn-helix transcriptional regulator [Rhizobium]|uniref:MarR family transcriptional regulator n=1 Tax=Rhizobium tropici TaxID=398 RepID=A0A6P1C4H4_RHITR|nr:MULTISPECIES: MarR family transcriptional regulator [Rhizobium]AGB74986.1 transcriptional regulator, MarR family [Rhizobium tropici CIAT 899]MBB4243068.1 DNA-binding MarR family transcriptional regulator [Rhizobium tropici]MBB5594517.1 DNA-binding MarR family transcriptional regulator [Rhizobium tropici]MBB6493394.1 DNA-binding MarR family transcriptional regulator [Rhizobium tropici]NEV11597.1 MarR family transcriptional regulator [Rhizobium tropici]
MQLKNDQPENGLAEEREDGTALKPAFRLDRWIPYRMFLVASSTAELLASYYGPRYGLSQASWRILAIAGGRPGLSSKEICHAGALDQFAVSRGIAQLVSLGFARRNAGAGDRRFSAVELTSEGYKVLDEIVSIGQAMEARILESLSEHERELLHAMLDRIEDACAGAVARGWQAVVGDVRSGG